jgi:serine/threonine-protein kinase
MVASDRAEEPVVSAEPAVSPEPRPSVEPDLTGTTLDRYRLLRRLGVGGMGVVYEAEHVQLHKRFALKMLREELAQDELFRRRFLREARAASVVNHPHVVNISDFGETPDGRAFFVMELLEGRDLQELLETEGRLSWPRAQEILLQVTSALEAAHRQGVIHRDIKPSNCFLVDVPSPGGEVFVKVLDFGIAKLSGSLSQSTMRLTSTQEIFGTVAYMAPEMANGTSDDHRSDIYALGVMMYQMLVGELPFTEGNAFQILSQHVGTPPPRPRDKQPSVPEGVEAIILKAMAKDPNERFATMQEFGRALRAGHVEASSAGASSEALRTTMVGLLKRPASGRTTPVEKTTPLPSVAAVEAPPSTEVVEAASSVPGEVVEAASSVATEVVEAASSVPGEAVEAPPSMASEAVEAPPRVATEAVGAPPSGPVGVIEARKRSPLWLVLPLAGVAAVLGTVAFFVFSGPSEPSIAASDQEAPSEPESHEQSELQVDPNPPVSPRRAPEHEPTTTASAPVEPVPDEPRPSVVPSDGAAAKPSEEHVETPVEPEPAVETPPEPSTKQPERPGSSKLKRKSDREVVKALRAKIRAKCRVEGDTTVRVEGVISSSGRLASPLITPSTGPGACAKKIVMTAKFDPRPGVRPMPRFSVEL